MTEAQQKSILTEIVKGEKGQVEKSQLTEEKVTELQGFVGEKLDCRFDFTRTETVQNEEGVDVEQEVVEDMYCGALRETETHFTVERDMLANYDGTEVYPEFHELEGQNILSTLQAKTKVTL